MAYCGARSSAINMWAQNMTASYAGQSNEAPMVAGSILILLLAGVFFNLNLFRRFSDLSAIHNPKVRTVLSGVLSIFLPVMSYLFSEAKNSDPVDLPLQAGLILVWMLLVEILRYNVEEIRMRGFETSELLQRAGRVVLLGSFVFLNIQSAGRKAVLGGLWIVCASKLVQRVAFTEAGKRCYVHNKNARLIASYMSPLPTPPPSSTPPPLPTPQTLLTTTKHPEESSKVRDVDEEDVPPPVDGRPAELLKNCQYIVMVEENLVKKATAKGYELHKLDELKVAQGVITVGKVWTKLHERNRPFITSKQGDERLMRLCVSFALFKVLRRRFEQMGEMTAEETNDCRDLIFKGLYKYKWEVTAKKSRNCKDLVIFKWLYNNDPQVEVTPEEAAAVAVFHVMNDEVKFLSEYYHSVVPVVLANPFFFLCNYLLLPVVLLGLWLMTTVLCGNGDVRYAFTSIATDNSTLNSGMTRLAICLLQRAINLKSAAAFFAMVDLSITVLLFLIFLYEELWEFLVFILSNWFVISLLRNYITKEKWRGTGAFRFILWLRSKMRPGKLSLKQFSPLNLRIPLIIAIPSVLSTTVRSVPVPRKVKHSIVKYLVKIHQDDGAHATLTNGMPALAVAENNGPLWQSESISEVILTWHIATSIFEVKYPLAAPKSAVARRLSNYCAYLVAFHKELLPDNPEKTEHVFNAMKKELRSTLGFVGYYFLCRRARADKILPKKLARDDAKLAQLLGFVGYYFSWLRARADKILSSVTEGQKTAQQENRCCTEMDKEVVKNGGKLAQVLICEAANKNGSLNAEEVWQILADVWTQPIVYIAPSSDEGAVKGHEGLLVQGGEFLTVLWALTTHTGVSRATTDTNSSVGHAALA